MHAAEEGDGGKHTRTTFAPAVVDGPHSAPDPFGLAYVCGQGKRAGGDDAAAAEEWLLAYMQNYPRKCSQAKGYRAVACMVTGGGW